MCERLLQRESFRTSRLLDFFSEKELAAQIGHQVADWPLVIGKELIDNSLDACEEASPYYSPQSPIALGAATGNAPRFQRRSHLAG